MAEDAKETTNLHGLLEAINPDGDDVVTSEEFIAFVKKHLLEPNVKAYSHLLDRAEREGISRKELAQAATEMLRENASPDSDSPPLTISAEDISPRGIIAPLYAACELSRENPTEEIKKTAKGVMDLQRAYPDIVAAIQLRSGPLGDIVLSEEEKAAIPKLSPSDAYSLPLFVNFPEHEQVCAMLKQTMDELDPADPVSPLPATTGQQASPATPPKGR